MLLSGDAAKESACFDQDSGNMFEFAGDFFPRQTFVIFYI